MITEYLNYLNSRRTQNTAEAYAYVVKEFTTTHTLTPKDIQTYVTELYAKNNKKKTIRLKLAALEDYCRFTNIDLDKTFKEERKTLKKEIAEKVVCKLTAEDIIKFRDFFKQKNDLRGLLILDLLVSTGARVSEVLDLKLSDFNLDKKTLIIRQTKTGELRENVDLTKLTEQSLVSYIKSYNITDKLTDKLFDIDRHVVDSLLRRRMHEFNEVNGTNLPITSAHKFRHFFCTYWGGRVGNAFALQQITGHKSIESLQNYVHVDKSADYRDERRNFLS